MAILWEEEAVIDTSCILCQQWYSNQEKVFTFPWIWGTGVLDIVTFTTNAHLHWGTLTPRKTLLIFVCGVKGLSHDGQTFYHWFSYQAVNYSFEYISRQWGENITIDSRKFPSYPFLRYSHQTKIPPQANSSSPLQCIDLWLQKRFDFKIHLRDRLKGVPWFISEVWNIWDKGLP